MRSVNLKTIISQQVPNFVREDHPAFLQFLEAYYEYVDQNVNEDISTLRDLDTTLDEFVLYMKKELDVFGDSEYQYIDKILLLRKIKQLLVAKGSEAAYKFLFKILYDKPVNISYPWDSVLKASDGKWKRDTSLFIRITEGNPLSIAGSRVSIVNPLRTMFVYVDNIRHVENDVFEFFIEKSYYGVIEVGNELVYDGVRGVILPTTVGYEIINPGVGYKIGDVINGSTFANNKTINQRLKVTGVDANGGITSLITLRFGYDYVSEFFLYTTNEQAIRKSRFALTRDSVAQFDLPDNSEIERYQDYGQITAPNYWVSYTREFTVTSSTVNTTAETVTYSAHGLVTGDVVTYTTTGSDIGGLTSGDTYFVIRVDNNTIKLALSISAAVAGNAINLTDVGSGNHTFSAVPVSDISYTGTLLQQFYTETINNIAQPENFTLIRFDIGAVAKYQGYYYSNDGFLSDNIYLQDSKYYQKYSYLITVDERLEDYKSLLKSFIHPAGTALFGEYQIQNNFTTNLSVTFTLEEFESKASIVTINKSTTDSLSTSDLGGFVEVNPYDLENYYLRSLDSDDNYNVGTETPTTIPA